MQAECTVTVGSMSYNRGRLRLDTQTSQQEKFAELQEEQAEARASLGALLEELGSPVSSPSLVVIPSALVCSAAPHPAHRPAFGTHANAPDS